jgi:hypothetical protein
LELGKNFILVHSHLNILLLLHSLVENAYWYLVS